MRRLLWSTAVGVGILAWSVPAAAQQGHSAARWINPGGGNPHGGRMQGGTHSGHGAQAAPSPGSQAGSHAQPAGHGSGRMFGSAPVGSVTDPGFAGRLGKTVGMNGQPDAALPPGFGNINHPGVQPLPLTPQPLQTGSPFPIPNINFPGGAPGLHGNHPHGKGGQFHHGSRGGQFLGTIIVPYYVPVYTYTEVITTTPASPPEPPRVPQPYDIQPYTGAQPPGGGQPQPRQPQATPSPQGRTVTLLAFKDSTVIAVTDYWLQGDMLVYETSSGSRTFVPLDRLDFALTQQLNFERNVRFVLEARP